MTYVNITRFNVLLEVWNVLVFAVDIQKYITFLVVNYNYKYFDNAQQGKLTHYLHYKFIANAINNKVLLTFLVSIRESLDYYSFQ